MGTASMTPAVSRTRCASSSAASRGVGCGVVCGLGWASGVAGVVETTLRRRLSGGESRGELDAIDGERDDMDDADDDSGGGIWSKAAWNEKGNWFDKMSPEKYGYWRSPKGCCWYFEWSILGSIPKEWISIFIERSAS